MRRHEKLTFLNHFLMCLAMAGAAFFATLWGIPQTIWANDATHITSAIGGVFIASAGYLGFLAWRLDAHSARAVEIASEWGWFIEEKFLRLGLLGTVVGLSMEAMTLSNGTAGLAPLATALYCSGCGILASLLIAALSWNLDRGIRRMKQ